jgi:hypothetical protein
LRYRYGPAVTYASPYLVFEERLEHGEHSIKVERLIDHMESFEPQRKGFLQAIKQNVMSLLCLTETSTVEVSGIKVLSHVIAFQLVCWFSEDEQ